jgi:Flp pilus assembly protein TadG
VRNNMRRQTGQSLVETILIMPLFLLLLLNAINFGYFFMTVLDITATSRSGILYAIMGAETVTAPSLPLSGPPTTKSTVSYLSYRDMTGALSNPTSATIQVCTQTNIVGGSGLNGTGANQKSNCVLCAGGSCTNTTTWVPSSDPELRGTTPAFVLNRVDVQYSFIPLIPGRPFNIALMAACGSGDSCTFHRFAEMRAVN